MIAFGSEIEHVTFSDLVEEGRSLIPRFAPTWTDHNAHDPGITLIELLAWLVESDLYRSNRVPETAYKAFLHLLGIRPQAAQVAETILSLRLEGNTAVTLPAGWRITSSDKQLVFQTDGELAASPAQLMALRTGLSTAPIDPLKRRRLPFDPYPVFGPQAGVGCAFYLGFDRPLEGTINLYVWTGNAQADRETRQRLIDEAKRLQTALLPHCSSDTVPNWTEHYSVHTVWEYFGANGWTALGDVHDETCAMTLTGAVQFRLPETHIAGGLNENLYFIRCRWSDGQYECPPCIIHVAHNTVLVRNEEDFSEVNFAVSNGRAGQIFNLKQKPIIAGSTQLKVSRANYPDEIWQEVFDLGQVGPHDRAYQLISDSGKIIFGNGRAGRVLPAGSVLTINYRAGGGVAGNLSAQSLNQRRQVNGIHCNIQQQFAIAGGTQAETLTDAKARAVNFLAQTYRAITLADYEMLALETPAVPVGRVRAIADYHPDVPCFPALGCVTVVIVPECSGSRPEPSKDMLAAVRRYLDRRRTLTTELYVIGPKYTTVVVNARLIPGGDTRSSELKQMAQAALDDFFHPLHGGPDATGWPIGRDVYLSEILALLNNLPGVAYVDDCALQFCDEADARCENLSICPDSLIASGTHSITVLERSHRC